MRIFIDNGHGGTDSGAVSKNGQREDRTNLNVANELVRLLRLSGHQVLQSNPKCLKLDLSNRIKLAHRFGAELSISVHHNGGGGDGSEIFVEVGDPKSNLLGECILSEFSKLNNIRGIKVKPSTKDPKKNYLAMLNIKECVCVLTEFAFMDSKDIESIDTLAEQKLEAQAIYNGIARYIHG